MTRVALTDIDQHKLAVTARTLREKQWKDELEPHDGWTPTMEKRLSVLRQAVDLERAVIAPSSYAYDVEDES